MPLPFILGAAALGAAGFGAKKAFDGFNTKSEAEEIKKIAGESYDIYKKCFDDENQQVSEYLEELGNLQLKIGSDFKEFKEISDELLGKIEQSDLEKKITVPSHQLNKIADLSMSATAYLGQLAGGAVAGAAAAYAVYGGVMALAAASTGTPIAALAGAAAHNAAMAAIGGGSLAAGGFGMAGGAMVLGAVVAAPIIAIAGLGFNMHAEKAKQNAVAYKEEVNQAVEKMKLSIEHLNKTSSYVTDLIVEIKRIDGQFNQYFDKLKSINTLLKDGTLDFDSLKDSILLTINNGYILAAILTDIITTPLFKVKKNSFDKMVMDGDQPVMELDENGLQILNKEEMKTAVLKGSNEEISKALKS